jgi:hypothetical protein
VTNQTKRDTVWGTSLQLAMELEEFDIAEVLAESGLDSSSKRTTRSVLSAMEEQGWIESRTCEKTGRLLYSQGELLVAPPTDDGSSNTSHTS